MATSAKLRWLNYRLPIGIRIRHWLAGVAFLLLGVNVHAQQRPVATSWEVIPDPSGDRLKMRAEGGRTQTGPEDYYYLTAEVGHDPAVYTLQLRTGERDKDGWRRGLHVSCEGKELKGQFVPPPKVPELGMRKILNTTHTIDRDLLDIGNKKGLGVTLLWDGVTESFRIEPKVIEAFLQFCDAEDEELARRKNDVALADAIAGRRTKIVKRIADALARRSGYVSAHPALTPELKHLILNGQVQRGMTEAEVTAAKGEPATRKHAEKGSFEIWTYGPPRSATVLTFSGGSVLNVEQRSPFHLVNGTMVEDPDPAEKSK